MIDDPDEQAEDDADDCAGDDGEIECAVFAAMNNVAGKTAKAQGEFSAEVKESPDKDEYGTENQKRAA